MRVLVHHYYDGLDDIEVASFASGAETLSRRMVYGERINELLEHTDVSADPDVDYYSHADKLDSVMVLAEADGDNAESYRYKEYGEPTVVDSSFAKLTTLNSNVGNWKRYTGQEHALPASTSDPWQFYRARAYRADAGRFVQRDPRLYVEGSNLFNYVNGRPINAVDPLGTSLVLDPYTAWWMAMVACCLAGDQKCCRLIGGGQPSSDTEPTDEPLPPKPLPPGPTPPPVANDNCEGLPKVAYCDCMHAKCVAKLDNCFDNCVEACEDAQTVVEHFGHAYLPPGPFAKGWAVGATISVPICIAINCSGMQHDNNTTKCNEERTDCLSDGQFDMPACNW